MRAKRPSGKKKKRRGLRSRMAFLKESRPVRAKLKIATRKVHIAQQDLRSRKGLSEAWGKGSYIQIGGEQTGKEQMQEMKGALTLGMERMVESDKRWLRKARVEQIELARQLAAIRQKYGYKK